VGEREREVGKRGKEHYTLKLQEQFSL